MNLLEENVQRMVNRLEQLHIDDDYARYKIWRELAEELSKDEKLTIDYLIKCEDSTTIDNVASVFKDISYKLQSRKFIECIEILERKFPDLLLKYMVQAAKDAMLDD